MKRFTINGVNYDFESASGGLAQDRTFPDLLTAVVDAVNLDAGSSYVYGPTEITTVTEFNTAADSAISGNNGVLRLSRGTFTIDITPPYTETYAAIVVNDGETLIVEGDGREETILKVTPNDLTGLGSATKLFYVRPGGTLILRNIHLEGHNSLGNSTPHDGTTGYVTNRAVEMAGNAQLIMDNVKVTKWAEPVKSTYTQYAAATSLYSAWAAATRYYPGDRVVSSSKVYECLVGGISHATTGPSSSAGEEITDGTVTWTFIASSTNFEIGSKTLINNCLFNCRGQIYYSQGQTSSGWDETSSCLTVLNTTFDLARDGMNTAADGSGVGHCIYAGPGVNLLVDGCSFKRVIGTNRAIQINDSGGYDCKAKSCVISNSFFSRNCIFALENNQYIDTIVTGCSFEYYSSAFAVRSSNGRLIVTGCSFRDVGANGSAVSYSNTADVEAVFSGCTFYGEVAPTGGRRPAFINLSTGNARTKHWRFTDCSFGGNANGPAAARTQGANTMSVSFDRCTFGTTTLEAQAFCSSATWAFKDCRFTGSKGVWVYHASESTPEAGNVAIDMTGCVGGTSNPLLTVTAPATYTVTITGQDNEWPSGGGPTIANSTSVIGYLKPKQKTGSTIASSGTITLDNNANTFHISGTTTIDTISVNGTTAPLRAVGGPVTLIFDSTAATSTSGNILPRHTAARTANETATFFYDKTLSKWVEHGYLTATPSLNINGTTGNTLAVDSTGLVYDATNNYIGIGTASPSTTLNIVLPAIENVVLDGRTNPRQVTPGVFRINHTAGTTGTRPINMNVNMASYGDTNGAILDYVATGMTSTMEATGFAVNFDTSTATGGQFGAFHAAKTGTGTANVYGLQVHESVNPVLHYSGALGAADKCWKLSGAAYTDVTTAFGDTSTDVQIFAADDDYIIIGHSTKFNDIGVILSTAASHNIQPTFEYSAGGGSWTTFSPTDGTNGFQLNGNITWNESGLTGWSTDTVNGVGSKYWVRIKRQRNNLSTPPTEDSIKITLATQYSWNSNGDISIRRATLAGGIILPYRAITAQDTLSDADYVVDCTANTFTVYLPTAVGRTGRVFNVKNSGAGVITVDGDGTETIDGATTYSLSTQYQSVTVQSNGSNWIII